MNSLARRLLTNEHRDIHFVPNTQGCEGIVGQGMSGFAGTLRDHEHIQKICARRRRQGDRDRRDWVIKSFRQDENGFVYGVQLGRGLATETPVPEEGLELVKIASDDETGFTLRYIS